MLTRKKIRDRNSSGTAWRCLGALATGFLAAIVLLTPATAGAGFTRRPPPPPYTPPSTPGNFHVTAVTESSISFAWSPSKAGTDPSFVYVIEELSPSDGYSLNVGNVTSFVWDIGIAQSTPYTFEIFAVDSNNHASAPSPIVSVTTPPTPIIPAMPVITGTNVTATTVTVSWTEATPSSDLNGYLVFVDGLGNPSVTFNSGTPATATSATISGLFAQTTYSIEVVAQSTTFDQATSEVVTATTTVSPNNIPPTAPTGLAVTYDVNTGLPDLSWNPSTSPYEPSSAIQYLIVEDGVADTEDSPPPGQTFADDVFNRVGSGQMSVSVVAIDQFGNVSSPSNVISVTTFN
jgi:hypothetical protein